MSDAEFAPRCQKLRKLIETAEGVEGISQFLSQDPELIEYLRRRDLFDGEALHAWNYTIPPLHRAAFLGRADILEALLQRFSVCTDSRWISAGYSMTALHWAILGAHPSCVRVLVEQGADRSLGGSSYYIKDFKSALSYAEKEGVNEEIIQILKLEDIKGMKNNFLPWLDKF